MSGEPKDFPEDDEVRRRDDSLLRKIAVGVTIAIVAQAAFSIYYAGSLANQVNNNTRAIEALVKRSEFQDANSVTLERVKTLVETMSINMTRIADKVDNVATEQQRRTSVIDRAERHMQRAND